MTSPFVQREPFPYAVSSISDSLAGLRLAVKDLFAIKGMPTTAGNPTWSKTHPIPQATSSVIETLLAHGASYVGKTITDELAYSLNGQNKHYGTPVNPVTPDRLPGGSSSGSAVAVAANEADIGLGTDTGGSIRVPASYNHLFGLRTTHDLIARDNMVALAPSFDTVGVMTKDLSTLASTMRVLCDAPMLEPLQPRLTLADTLLGCCVHADLIRQWTDGLNNISLTHDTSLDADAMSAAETFRILQGAEIRDEHGEWISQCCPDFADDIQQRFDACMTITTQQIQRAKSTQQQIAERLEKVLSQTDAILVPTTPGIAPRMDAPASSLAAYRQRLLSLTAFAGLAGLPQLHLPLFTLHNAPCGLSLIGKKGSDLALISYARWLMEYSQ
ncbi:amidase [Alteromonas sp. H39]|uniref:amidase n=1 Tax=Alteromonas sp. H39 TaxID=3389876 RepID=UPI0039E1C7DD